MGSKKRGGEGGREGERRGSWVRYLGLFISYNIYLCYVLCRKLKEQCFFLFEHIGQLLCRTAPS